MPIDIPKFDPSKMVTDAVAIFFGPRRTGKTTTLLSILSHLSDKFYGVILQTPTDTTRRQLANHIPRSFIYDDFDLNAIKRLIEGIRTMNKAIAMDAERKGMPVPPKRKILIMLDDCMDDPRRFQSKEIRHIFNAGRHDGIMFINLQQYMMDLKPGARTNIDYVIATRDEDPTNVDRLWKYFFRSAFSDRDRFQRVYEACTANYGVIIYDRTRADVDHASKRIFWYRAPTETPPRFKLGHSDLWYLHMKHLRSRRDELHQSKDHIKEVTRSAFAEAPTGRVGLRFTIENDNVMHVEDV